MAREEISSCGSSRPAKQPKITNRQIDTSSGATTWVLAPILSAWQFGFGSKRQPDSIGSLETLEIEEVVLRSIQRPWGLQSSSVSFRSARCGSDDPSSKIWIVRICWLGLGLGWFGGLTLAISEFAKPEVPDCIHLELPHLAGPSDYLGPVFVQYHGLSALQPVFGLQMN
jgi:hypothetical protein